MKIQIILAMALITYFTPMAHATFACKTGGDVVLMKESIKGPGYTDFEVHVGNKQFQFSSAFAPYQDGQGKRWSMAKDSVSGVAVGRALNEQYALHIFVPSEKPTVVDCMQNW